MGVEATKVARHAPNFHPPGSMAYYDRRKCAEAIKALGGAARTEGRPVPRKGRESTHPGWLSIHHGKSMFRKILQHPTGTVAMDNRGSILDRSDCEAEVARGAEMRDCTTALARGFIVYSDYCRSVGFNFEYYTIEWLLDHGIRRTPREGDGKRGWITLRDGGMKR